MSLREEQCKKVCRILDDVLANRPTERDSLIVAVRKAFESLEQFGNSEPLPSAQPERRCVNCGRTVNNGGWYEDGTSMELAGDELKEYYLNKYTPVYLQGSKFTFSCGLSFGF